MYGSYWDIFNGGNTGNSILIIICTCIIVTRGAMMKVGEHVNDWIIYGVW